ncbi:tRNA pseudouridine(38-40) synthase TruA [Methanosarcinales archaeon]|nr:MAG: tRNA pseudouridine(38-40) synthase TruA [Methanosarcinales archaeon]
MVRLALKVGYIGSAYHGFQIQPDLPTVEGKLCEGLESSGVISDRRASRFISAGRTDRGVHALGQVVAFDTDNYRLAVPRIINTFLPEDIWVWARSEVDLSFDPRRDALSREYRYILYAGSLEIERMKEASKILIGRHDFASFSKRGDELTTIRDVHKIDLKMQNDLIIFDISADAFLWQMVRRIVAALALVGSGEKDSDWLEGLLNSKTSTIAPAPAYGLILRDVSYGDLKFEVDRYVRDRMVSALSERFEHYAVLKGVMDEMRNNKLI